ncbi:penicillin-binding protein [Virgibacillus phasianinus]|uniref:Penicillin-binding protein n=1 Tax=Virgibacillus phasianinus TaxID=2017483 RepID=A0A220U6R7_9BACI|nr:serine hydrolase domain-containing protein [Virgibacillus phasianinus]ASK63848.1 penicillin-binding protein [Virgibacillus phasianinus]
MELININIVERMEHYHVTGLSMAMINNSKQSRTTSYGLLEKGTNNHVKDGSIFNACSISKFLTSMLVMKIVEQGDFDLDEDVNKKLTSWKVPDNTFTVDKKVTLRLLLSHQSGVMDPPGSFDELNFVYGEPRMVELLKGRTPYCRETIEVKFEPGSDFHYSDAGYCIIQLLIEDSFKKPFKQVMKEQVFDPLGMTNSTFDQIECKEFSSGHNKNGEALEYKYSVYPYPAASGLWTTPTDLALLVIELMDSLKDESKAGLTVYSAKEMIQAQGCKEWTGLGVFLDESERGLEISSLGWGRGFQCMMIASPYLETGAVIMTNTDLGVHQLEGIIGEIYQDLKSI